jgi:hypothetical protein
MISGRYVIYSHGYGALNESPFISFGKDLTEGEWASIEAGEWDARFLEDPLAVPLGVASKIRLLWGIKNLISAKAAADNLPQADKTWDSKQKRVFGKLILSSEDDDPAVREAAERLKVTLLKGGGLAQTTLGADEEVDFGREQLNLAAQPDVAADVRLTGLGPLLEEVRVATEDLATAVGRGSGKQRKAPGERLRLALVACRIDFNGVHDDLDAALKRLGPGQPRDRIAALLQPLEQMLDRARQKVTTASTTTTDAPTTEAGTSDTPTGTEEPPA